MSRKREACFLDAEETAIMLQDAIIFEATDVVKAIGGVSPSILLSGRRAVLPSAGSSARQPASLGGLGSTLADLEPWCRTLASPAGVCWETVVLGIGYEEPSPKIRRRRPSLSPYQLTLHDADASLLCSLRGLPCELQADAAAGTLRWGPLFLRLCETAALQRVLSVLRRVDVAHVDLSHLSTGLAALASKPRAPGAREASGSEPLLAPPPAGLLRPPPLRLCPKEDALGGGAPASPGPMTPTLGAGSDFAAKQLSVCLSTLGRGREAEGARAEGARAEGGWAEGARAEGGWAGLAAPASGPADAHECLGATSAEPWAPKRSLAGHPLLFSAAGPLTPQASAALVLTPLKASRRCGSEPDFSAPPLTPAGPLSSANWQRKVPAGASP